MLTEGEVVVEGEHHAATYGRAQARGRDQHGPHMAGGNDRHGLRDEPRALTDMHGQGVDARANQQGTHGDARTRSLVGNRKQLDLEK